MNNSNIHESWNPLFEKWSHTINENLKIYDSSAKIYPPKADVFKVFSLSVHDIKLVLLGQDPYHKAGQANGLSFSVNDGVRTPPSLLNIFKELVLEFPERNYSFKSGNLNRWVLEEKIFLLNSSLTVLEASPGSFMKEWENFTNDVIKFISENNDKCVFLLLGNFSKKKISYCKNEERCVMGTHPSPLCAHRGFFGSNIFRKCEETLTMEINWSL